MDPSSISALTFDVFGTVVDWRTSVTREGEAFGKPRKLSVDWAKFADAWRGLYQPAMEEVRSGRRPWAKLDELHRESLVRLLGDFGITGVSPAEIDHLNYAWHRLDPWPDAVPGLTRLKQRFTLATLSNGNIALMVDMAKRAGLPWDAILGAEAARALQADPRGLPAQRRGPGAPPRAVPHGGRPPGGSGRGGALRPAHRLRAAPARVRARPPRFAAGAGQPFDVVASDFVELALKLGC